MKTLNPTVARVLKLLHHPLDVILTCVRWYVAYPLAFGTDKDCDRQPRPCA
jgi:putative transposase